MVAATVMRLVSWVLGQSESGHVSSRHVTYR